MYHIPSSIHCTLQIHELYINLQRKDDIFSIVRVHSTLTDLMNEDLLLATLDELDTVHKRVLLRRSHLEKNTCT